MLDTSDKAVFHGSYDPSMGTYVQAVNVGDVITPLLGFNEKRRTLMIQNTGNKLYLSFGSNVATNLYSISLSTNAFFAIDNYGGIVTAIRDSGVQSVVYITEIQ